MEYLQIITTVGRLEDGEKIARALLERRLAACVQIVGPVISHYRWQGKLEREQEYRCEIKSRARQFAAVEAAILGLHPYEVPEIIALPLAAVGGGYGQWLNEELA